MRDEVHASMEDERGRGRRRGRREHRPFPPRPEYRDIVAVVLDYLPTGYYRDPHPHHRNAPVVQALGVTYFSLVDGIPLEPNIDFFEKVTVAQEVNVRVPLYQAAPTRVRLACIPGRERGTLLCYVADEVPPDSADIIAGAFPNPDAVEIIVDYESFLDLLRGRDLPDKVIMAPPSKISYEDLTPTARDNLPEAVKQILRENESFFVHFFNIAEPINVRLHTIELLRGVGKKTLQRFLLERQRRPFTSYEDVKRILKADPVEVLADKILEELRGEASRYYLFVEPPSSGEARYVFLDYPRRIKRWLQSRRPPPG